MLLAKSCNKEFNIKKSLTLKIGTLFEYRDIENKELADLNEGKLFFTLHFDGDVVVEKKWLNTLFRGGVKVGNTEDVGFQHPGSCHIYAHRLQIVPAINGVAVRDTVVHITRESVNSFIFCMSRVRRTTDCIGMFKGYDDYWYITEHKAAYFGASVGNALLEAIKREHLAGNYIISKDAPIDEIEIFVAHGSVTYANRHTHITNKNIISLNDYMIKMDNMAFTKPSTPFEKESEYRFQYIMVSKDGTIYPPLVKNYIIDAIRLLPIVI